MKKIPSVFSDFVESAKLILGELLEKYGFDDPIVKSLGHECCVSFERGGELFSVSYEVAGGLWVVLTVGPSANKKVSADFMLKSVLKKRNPDEDYPMLRDSGEKLATREQFDEYMKCVASVLKGNFMDFLRGSDDLGSSYRSEFRR